MIGVDYGVLNQKGSPSWFSDIYANIPTAGYKGRMFISIDTYAFYRDTGTGWDLIGGPGTGTITGSGTSGQVSYFNGSSTLAGSNNLFWDITNSRLGIGTATPGASLDIHSTGTNAQFNGTGTNNAYLVFQNAGTSKWRIGNTYNAGANSFDIYNNGLANTPLSINSATNLITLSANVTTTGIQAIQNGLNLGYASGGATASYTNMSGSTTGINFALANGTGGASFIFPTAAGYNYTFPATTGTLALTSNLSSYLPLAGGTLTGALTGTTALFNTSAQIGGSSYNLAKLNVQGVAGTYLLDLTNGTEGNFKLRVYNNGSATSPGLAFKQGMFYDEVENGLIKYYRGTFGYDGYIALATGGVDRFNISYGGYVGIGNTNTTYNLDITGTLRTSGSAYFGTSSGNVLIGTTTSTGAGASRLQITGASSQVLVSNTTSSGHIALYSTGVDAYITKNVSSGTMYFGLSPQDGSSFTEQMRITSAGNVGINNTSPSTYLDVSNNGTNNNAYITTRNAGVSGYRSGAVFINSAAGGLSWYLVSTNNGDGDWGGGKFAISTNNGIGVYLNGASATSWTGQSDIRLKDIDSEIENALDKVNQLRGVRFTWKSDETKKMQVGLIAQEVKEVLPEAVDFDETNEDYKMGVQYTDIIPLLVNAIKELNEKLVRNNIN